MKTLKFVCAAVAALGLGGISPAETVEVPATVTTQAELAEIIEAAGEGTTIRLPAGPIQFSRPNASSDNAIVIDKSLTLEGPVAGCAFVGVAGTSGNGASFLKTTAGTTVTLKNIVFRDTFSPRDTFELSPVRAEGALVMEKCEFKNILRLGGQGQGGALRTSSDTTLRDCVFADCAIIMGNDVYGGAWAALGGRVSAVSTVFTNCFCSSGGGAVYLANTVTGARFEKTKFFDVCCDNGGASGGAIYDRMVASSFGLDVVDCVFRNCYAKEGGVLHSQSGGAHRIVFERCEITDCYSSGWGGAVKCNSGNPLVFLFTTFAGTGGAGWGAVMDIRCQLYMVNCTMAGCFNRANTAKAGGGVNTFSTASILNSVLAYNYHDLGAANIDLAVYSGTTRLINSIANSPQTPKYESGSEKYTLAASLDDLGAATDLFAEYETTSTFSLPGNSWQTAYISGRYSLVHDLNQTVVVPVVTQPLKRVDSRAVLPSATGRLKDGSFPVKADAARRYIAWSEDDGATWKTLYGTDPNDGTVEVLTCDQLGQTFAKAPIGAVVNSQAQGLTLFVR